VHFKSGLFDIKTNEGIKYFEKQFIKAGEIKTFRFEIDLKRDFGYVDNTGKKYLESGDYYVIVKDKK
jgi:beta-glucosidase